MPQVINTNVMSLNAQRNLNKTQTSLSTALQRLSSGLRINSAKDDAAGLAISERFNAQIRGLNQAIRNANDAISLSQTAEGALSEYSNNLQRIRELSIQSANATNSASDRQALNAEVDQLLSEMQRVATQTQFNGQNILDGTFNGAQFQIGSNAGQIVTVNVTNSQTNSLGSYQVGASAVAVGASALTGGDLLINGVDTGVSVSNSAEDKAAAINSISPETGVSATGSTSVASANSLLRNQGLQSGDLVINGVNIGATNGSTNLASQGQNVAAAINNLTNQHGITASANLSTGALTLSSSTGKNIDITSLNADVGLNRVENATGFEVRDVTATQSTSVTTFAGGALGVTTVAVADDDVAVADTITVQNRVYEFSADAGGGLTASGNFALGAAATGVGSGATNATAIFTRLDADVTAGTLSNVTVTDGGGSAVITSDVMTSTTTHTDATSAIAFTAATTNSVGAAGVGVGDTLSLSGVVYEFTFDGTGASAGTTGVSLALDDATIGQNYRAAINSEYTAGNTNIQATGAAAAITLTTDLLGSDTASVTVTESGLGVAGVSTAAATAGTDGAEVAFAVRGILELNSPEQFVITGNNTDRAGLQAASATLTAISTIDISTVAGANTSIALVDGALSQVASIRADLGAIQNRLESTTANLAAASENFSAARSRILDADFAAETAALTRSQILQQAGIAMLTQANAQPQSVLALLQ